MDTPIYRYVCDVDKKHRVKNCRLCIWDGATLCGRCRGWTMLSRKAKVAPKAQKKTPGGRSRYLLDGNTAQKAGVSSVNKDTGIIPRKEVAKVEVHYDDPAVVDALALQDLSEEELEQRKLQLEQLKLDVIQDHSLPLRDMLQDEGCNWVFHRGAINANLMIIGEAPGEKEAELGR